MPPKLKISTKKAAEVAAEAVAVAEVAVAAPESKYLASLSPSHWRFLEPTST